MGKKFYLTKKGIEKIKSEYKNLKRIKVSKTSGEVPKIWQSEDLNPEYLSFQEDLGLLESRITELEYVIKNAELIQVPSKDKQGVVGLGAVVILEVDGQIDEFEIVGSLEANPIIGRISDESPVGKALIGHCVGAEVVVSSFTKTIYKVKDIRYQS